MKKQRKKRFRDIVQFHEFMKGVALDGSAKNEFIKQTRNTTPYTILKYLTVEKGFNSPLFSSLNITNV